MRVDELKEFIVLDTETTGFKPNAGADAIEVSALKVVKDENGKFKVTETFDTYINPGYPLPPAIVEFNAKNNTGVDDTFLADKPSPEEAAKAVFEFVGDNPVIIGHNIGFDIGFIDKLYQNQLGIPFTPNERIDTLALCRDKIASKSHKLGDMFELTQKRNSGENPVFHNSLADCLATLDVLEFIADKFYPNYIYVKGNPETIEESADKEPAIDPEKSAEENYEAFASYVSPAQKSREVLEAAILNPMNANIRDIPFHMLNTDIAGIAVGLDDKGGFIKDALKVLLSNENNDLNEYACRKITETKSSADPVKYFAVAYRETSVPSNVNICGYVSKKGSPQLIRNLVLDLSDRNVLGNNALCDFDTDMTKLFNEMSASLNNKTKGTER